MLPYSAKKNRANDIAEYSVLYPATNSASASGKSNGVRFVSAKQAMPKTTAIGRHGTMYHKTSWLATIMIRLAVPANKIRVKRMMEKKTSYDTICALERKAPMKAYLLFELQPDRIMA
jgi:hypothetical protein